MRGFSFVELLVATSMVAISGTGLITLQTHFVQLDEQQALRTHAWYLAQEKLDDLAHFQWLESSDQNANDFKSIANNKGGQLPAGQILHPVGVSTSVNFQRNWQVTDVYFVDTTGNGQPDSWQSGSQLSTAQQKLVTVVQAKQVVVQVSWTDNKGKLNTVTAEGVIAPILAARAGVALNPYVARVPAIGISPTGN